jgi:hypothetical protein
MRKKEGNRCRVRDGKEREDEEKRNISALEYLLFSLDHKSRMLVFSCSLNVQGRTTLYEKKKKEKNKQSSVALVRKRTISTERLPNVGEVSANFCG